MIASVHVADVGARRAVRLLRRPPGAVGIAGCRRLEVGVAASLSPAVVPKPTFGRVGLIGFWDDDVALDAFLADHPASEILNRGWRARLRPIRAWGSWPGLAEDLPSRRDQPHDGPAVVITLGRFRLGRAAAFFRTSAKAEGAVMRAPGLLWATGLARPPFVATCSLWQDTAALTRYAYGAPDQAHTNAIAADRHKPFHTRSAFLRFEAYESMGGLEDPNPLADGSLTVDESRRVEP